MKKYHLQLFFYDSCPFCQFVLSTIKSNKLKVDLRNILEDPEALAKLVQDTGRRTVPCLFINGKPMHESSDIIYWLEQHVNELNKPG